MAVSLIAAAPSGTTLVVGTWALRAGRDRRSHVAVAALLMAAKPALLAVAVSLFVPMAAHRKFSERSAKRRRERRLIEALPEVAELLSLCTGSGLSVIDAVRVASRASPLPVRGELAQALRDFEAGRPLAESLEAIPSRLTEEIRPLVSVLRSALLDGVPPSAPLAVPAAEWRARRRAMAQERARAVSVRLLGPLVICFLPAAVLSGLVPVVAGLLRDLHM